VQQLKGAQKMKDIQLAEAAKKNVEVQEKTCKTRCKDN
jgi:hypothetical protein